MKETVIVILMILGVSIPVWAEEDARSAEELARQAHERAQSDVIYQQEDFRALYYQNVQMIELLRDIKDELRQINIRDAKEANGKS